jgi:hypothetical protein
VVKGKKGHFLNKIVSTQNFCKCAQFVISPSIVHDFMGLARLEVVSPFEEFFKDFHFITKIFMFLLLYYFTYRGNLGISAYLERGNIVNFF